MQWLPHLGVGEILKERGDCSTFQTVVNRLQHLVAAVLASYIVSQLSRLVSHLTF